MPEIDTQCRLIVNADDFGESIEVTNGIISAHKNGIVTSASLIVNMPGFSHAVSCIKDTPTLDIGIHLNVHRGTPLTICPSLTKNEQFLHNFFLFIFSCYTRKSHARVEITAEFDAQVQKAIASGIRISHLDTEKHFHTLPFIFDIVLKIAEKYNIPAVRLPSERVTIATLLNPTQSYKALFMLLCSPFNKYLLSKSGRRSPDYFYGVSYSKNFTLGHLKNLFKTLKPGISELSCHPGYEPNAIKTYIDAHRNEELDVLTNPVLKKYALERGIVLSTFSDIG